MVDNWVQGYRKHCDPDLPGTETDLDARLDRAMGRLRSELSRIYGDRRHILELTAGIILEDLVSGFCDAAIEDYAPATARVLGLALWTLARHDAGDATYESSEGRLRVGDCVTEVRIEPAAQVGPVQVDVMVTIIDHPPPASVRRIAVLIPSLGPSGHQRVYEAVCRGLRDQGLLPVVIPQADVEADPFGVAKAILDYREDEPGDNVVPLHPF